VRHLLEERQVEREEITMSKNRIGFTLAAALMLFLAIASGAGADDTGVVKGSAKNLTAGGASLADAEVVLNSYMARQETGEWTAKFDKDGSFLFSDLDTQPGITYQISLEHQGATYYSPPLSFDVDTREHEVTLEVFDSTTDGSVITSSARHLLLEPTPGGVHVSEIMILRNQTDRTYIGGVEVHPGLRETLRFVLPDAATNLELGSGFLPTHAIPTEDGFVDTWPVFPGDDQRIYGYVIPSQDGSASFTTLINVTTDKVSVLMPDIGAGLSVSNLPDRSNPEIQGSKYLLFSGQNMAAGTELTFTVDGLPAGTGVSASGGGAEGLIAYVAGGGVIVVMVVAFGIVTIRRRRRAAYEMDEADLMDEEEDDLGENPDEDDELESERKDLVVSIASLDDAYEQGRIGSDEYGMLRSQQKDRLLEIVARQRELTDTRSAE
jgi:hypothetical protein